MISCTLATPLPAVLDMEPDEALAWFETLTDLKLHQRM